MIASGPDDRDRRTVPNDVKWMEAIKGDVKGLRIAWTPDWGYAQVDPEVRERTQIAITVSISRSTVGEYLWRAAVIGIPGRCRKGWTTASSNAGCSRRPAFEEKPARPLPNWTAAHRELKRRGVTLLPLWEEYRAEHADSARGLVRRANARV